MKDRTIWRNISETNKTCQINELGGVRVFDGKKWVEPYLINGYFILRNIRYSIADTVEKVFPRKEPGEVSPKHTQVLQGGNVLRFTHSVKTPRCVPDFEYKGMRLWYVPDGFICIATDRSFKQDNCKFVFPYEVSGNRAYLCRFEEIFPMTYRQIRNSGKVQILGVKEPVSYRTAISMVFTKLKKAKLSETRWVDGKTGVIMSYINHAIKNQYSGHPHAVNYQGNVYTLFVDHKFTRAEYRELICMDHLEELLAYVQKEKKIDASHDDYGFMTRQKLWFDAFGFTKSEFVKACSEIA